MLSNGIQTKYFRWCIYSPFYQIPSGKLGNSAWNTCDNYRWLLQMWSTNFKRIIIHKKIETLLLPFGTSFSVVLACIFLDEKELNFVVFFPLDVMVGIHLIHGMVLLVGCCGDARMLLVKEDAFKDPPPLPSIVRRGTRRGARVCRGRGSKERQPLWCL